MHFKTADLIFPSSSLSETQLSYVAMNMKKLDLAYSIPKHSEKHGYLAGKDEERLASVMAGFSSPSEVIWCARGGYGAMRLLPLLNPAALPVKPKTWLGYSDNTALLLHISNFKNQLAVHGPVVAEAWGTETLHFLQLFFRHDNTLTYHWKAFEKKFRHQVLVLVEGLAEGPVTGGNLSLLTALCGTPWQPEFKGKLVLMEEVGEKPYKIDRMLQQLWQATDIREAAGFIFGSFSKCETPAGGGHIPIEETIHELTAPLRVPVIFNFPAGHGTWQVPLPLERKAVLNTIAATLHYPDLTY